jgi:hypothetical protein
VAREFDGSNDSLSIGTAIVTAYPWTWACWFLIDTTTGVKTLMAEGDLAGLANYWALAPSENALTFFVQSTAGSDTAFIPSPTLSAGTWYHACAVGRATALIDLYLNGGNKASTVTARTPAGLDNTTLGVSRLSSDLNWHDGRIAEACLWNVALSDAEVAEIADPLTDPRTVQGANLIAYWPLCGDASPEPDEIGSNDLTVNGAIKADHPPGVFTICTGPPPPALRYNYSRFPKAKLQRA